MLTRKECLEHLNNPELILYHKVSKAIKEAVTVYRSCTAFYLSTEEEKLKDKLVQYLKGYGFDVYQYLTSSDVRTVPLFIVWGDDVISYVKSPVEKL